jgi:Transcription factor zinc-finger
MSGGEHSPRWRRISKEGQAVSDETKPAWQCPKDGVAMQPLGRRAGAWRCPTCRGIFMDIAAMRRGRPSKWSPMLTSVLMSLLATVVVRRLRRHADKKPAS